MPHIILECSDNLRDRCDVEDLVRTVHAAALDTGIFPVGGTRTRLVEYRSGRYRIADGDEDNAFLAITVRIARGRALATKQRAGRAIFDAVCLRLKGDETSPLAISLEVQEIDGDLN